MPDALKEISLSDIQVEDDHNPRHNFDEKALQSLADSIKTNGLITPISVTPAGKGKFKLIAGERRLRASRMAKCKTIAAHVRTDVGENAKALALVENLLREDLDPIEEAQAFAKAIEENGWNQKKLAAQIGVSTAQVSQRLSLLKLPPAAQALMASGAVALDHTKTLRDISDVSPDFAAYFAKLIAGEPRIEWDHIIEAERGFKGTAQLLFGSVSSDDLAALADDDLKAAIDAAFAGDYNGPRWDADDADAARSYGCLIEIPYHGHRGEKCTARYASDAEFLAGRLAQKVERKKQSNADKGKSTGSDKPEASAVELSPKKAEELKAQAAAEREADAKARAKARAFNFEVGEKLALALKEPEFTLERMQLLAQVILGGHENRHLGIASFALTDETTSEINDRGTMKIMSLGEAKSDLVARVANAKTPEQILGILMQAFVASQIVDTSCLPASAQPNYSFPGNWDEPPVGQRLALSEGLKVFKSGTNTYKRIKAKLDALKD